MTLQAEEPHEYIFIERELRAQGAFEAARLGSCSSFTELRADGRKLWISEQEGFILCYWQ